MPGQKATGSRRRAQILAAAIEVAEADGLERLTVRRVAASAGLSHGLVHFHFNTKEDLVAGLLDRVLNEAAALERVPATADAPLDRLLAVMRQEMARLSRTPGLTRLFFDFWVMGAHNSAIRARMGAELARYREAFRPLIEDVLRSEPERFAGVVPEGLCAVVVAFIKGSALQSVIDPEGFDVARFLDAASGLLAQLGSGATASSAVPRG